MKIHITSDAFELTRELEKYADRKIAEMAKHVPRKLRGVSICTLMFRQTDTKKVTHSTCSITFELGDAVLKSEETTLHMYAALDIAAVHIQQQLDDFAARGLRQRVRQRLRGRLRPSAEQPKK